MRFDPFAYANGTDSLRFGVADLRNAFRARDLSLEAGYCPPFLFTKAGGSPPLNDKFLV
jgi:hypothetical protein